MASTLDGFIISDEDLKMRGPGDFFGEMSLLGKGPRSATITAETDLLLEALNRREFATMLHKNPEIAEKILADADIRSTQ